MSDSPDDIARRIAELETTLKLPLPEAALAPLRAELARLRALLAGDTSESTSTHISDEANVGAAIGRDVYVSINHGPVLPPGASGVTVARTLNQFYGAHERESRVNPSPAYSASDVSQLRQQALLAAFRKDWIAAADLLARPIERDPHDAAAVTQLDHARSQLRLHDRYEVARVLQQAEEWQAVLGAIAEMMLRMPAIQIATSCGCGLSLSDSAR
jgi:hypothetical protein